jgi:hypothetical protein
MRVERTTNPQFHKCWLTTDEYEQLHGTTDSYHDELILRLGGEVGLRSFEIPQLTLAHPRREVIEDDSYLLPARARGQRHHQQRWQTA